MKKKVLVFDGRSRAALSIIRSLGKKGLYVIAGEAFHCSSFYSKYVKQKILYPPPDKKQLEFKEFIFDFLSENKVDVIIPVRDDVTEIVIENQKQFAGLSSFVLPSKMAFNSTRDKSKTFELARDLDIPHPKTILTDKDGFNPEIIKRDFELPLLIKPRISSGSRGIAIVNKWDQLQKEYDNVCKEYSTPMIQEFIPHGGAYGVSMLYSKGKSKASFTHKRVREFPPSGGPSTLREGVYYKEIESYSKTLLDKLEWNGVAMVEYRIDKRTGEPKLMEINPRFWGSLETAVYSGIDFPYLLYSLATNGSCQNAFTYNEGMQVRWFLFGDLLWFLKSKKNLNNLREFLRFKQKNLSYDIFSWRDIGPTYGAIKEAIYSFLRSDRRKHAFKRGWN